MQEIKEISEHIDEELHDSEKYAKCALKYKDIDPTLAEMYYNLSVDEMKHSNILHVQGVRLIDEYKAKGNTVPVSMQAVYDYLHQKNIDHSKEIRMYQEQYRS